MALPVKTERGPRRKARTCTGATESYQTMGSIRAHILKGVDYVVDGHRETDTAQRSGPRFASPTPRWDASVVHRDNRPTRGGKLQGGCMGFELIEVTVRERTAVKPHYCFCAGQGRCGQVSPDGDRSVPAGNELIQDGRPVYHFSGSRYHAALVRPWQASGAWAGTFDHHWASYLDQICC
jgi:hypothetical protein